jgi:large subunit ribosomal protein L35
MARGVSSMPKNKKKTNKSAAKRFWKTSSGKIKFKRAGTGHLMSGKSRKRKRHLRGTGILHKSEVRRINEVLGV